MPAVRRCPICAGAADLVLPGRGTDRPDDFAPTFHGVGGHGDLYRCRECGTVQQPSLPLGAELHGLYREMRDEDFLREEAGRRATARRLLDLLGREISTGRLIDIGCGHGLLLDEARRRGYEVEGVELSRHSAAYARERLGLTVHETSIEALAAPAGRFDAVVLADVIEHVADPVGLLSRCVDLLAPGGVLMIITPDPSSLAARIAGRRWWSYVPGHHCLIPRTTLRELIVATGLVPVREVPLRRVFSLGYWIAGLAARSGMLSDLLARVGVRFAERSLALSLGDEPVVLARRPELLVPERRLLADRGGPAQVHVVVPAYNAARTVELVAAALPEDAGDRALLVDDASPDATAQTAVSSGFDVLVHPVNRGYGANQKTCYVRAALDGADVVVMVHGDNQYDPALAAEMVRPIIEGRADVVIGSRLLEDAAVSGGMPRWKWVGNRALTWVENRAFERCFSEYHTGYRAFSVEFLRSIPFLRNSDDFVFDQEIFAQIVASDARVVELAIPTRYFLEASSVSFRASVVYGLKTLRVLWRFRAHRRGRRWALLGRPAAELRPHRAPAAGGDSSVSEPAGASR